jgi:hypothetical protein
MKFKKSLLWYCLKSSQIRILANLMQTISAVTNSEIVFLGWWHTAAHNRSAVPLPLLHGSAAQYDANQGPTGRLWIWAPTLTSIRTVRHQLIDFYRFFRLNLLPFLVVNINLQRSFEFLAMISRRIKTILSNFSRNFLS